MSIDEATNLFKDNADVTDLYAQKIDPVVLECVNELEDLFREFLFSKRFVHIETWPAFEHAVGLNDRSQNRCKQLIKENKLDITTATTAEALTLLLKEIARFYDGCNRGLMKDLSGMYEARYKVVE